MVVEDDAIVNQVTIVAVVGSVILAVLVGDLGPRSPASRFLAHTFAVWTCFVSSLLHC
jgi:hypothetical protein